MYVMQTDIWLNNNTNNWQNFDILFFVDPPLN